MANAMMVLPRAKNGVARQIRDKVERALYTHCYGHALSLACPDAIKENKIMEDALDTTREITKLIKRSPKRDLVFEKAKLQSAPDSPGIRVLCPTRFYYKYGKRPLVPSRTVIRLFVLKVFSLRLTDSTSCLESCYARKL